MIRHKPNPPLGLTVVTMMVLPSVIRGFTIEAGAAMTAGAASHAHVAACHRHTHPCCTHTPTASSWAATHRVGMGPQGLRTSAAVGAGCRLSSGLFGQLRGRPRKLSDAAPCDRPFRTVSDGFRTGVTPESALHGSPEQVRPIRPVWFGRVSKPRESRCCAPTCPSRESSLSPSPGPPWSCLCSCARCAHCE